MVAASSRNQHRTACSLVYASHCMHPVAKVTGASSNQHRPAFAPPQVFHVRVYCDVQRRSTPAKLTCHWLDVHRVCTWYSSGRQRYWQTRISDLRNPCALSLPLYPSSMLTTSAHTRVYTCKSELSPPSPRRHPPLPQSRACTSHGR